jgi:hypothetical protein
MSVLPPALNKSDEFEGLENLQEHYWTDEQMVYIFRIWSTGDKVQRYVTSILHWIHDQDVKPSNHESSKSGLALRNLGIFLRQRFDGSALDVEHLVLLLDALYDAHRKGLKSEEEQELPNLSSKCQESVTGTSCEELDQVIKLENTSGKGRGTVWRRRLEEIKSLILDMNFVSTSVIVLYSTWKFLKTLKLSWLLSSFKALNFPNSN